jgi:Methyltransferase domain
MLSVTMTRSEILRSMFEASGKGLEIGPSHNPLMPKAAGFDVEIFDYLDASALRSKYAAAGVDVSAVEEVDYIADGRPMTEVIGDRQRYEWIVASHVIEHVPGLLAFLVDCEALLKPGGSLVLAVPDKRCIFDILRPVSTVGQVLQAHVDGRKRPWPGAIFDDVAYARKRTDRTGWGLGDQEPLEEVRPVEVARQVFQDACASDHYVDVHCWVFVPSSFRLIISTLGACGMTGLRELNFQIGAGEFYAVLSTYGAPKPLDLGALALAAQKEEREALPLAMC